MIRLFLSLVLMLIPGSTLASSFKAEFVSASEEVLSNPHDLDLSRDGKFLYVADLGNGRVAVLDADTLKLVGAFGESDNLSSPHDAHIGPDGKLYVADTGNDRVVIYEIDGAKGKKVGEITGPFRYPEGAHAHPNGRVYIGGVRSSNVVAMKEGKVVAQLDGLSLPHDIHARKDGNLWIADSGNDRMLLTTPDLKVLKTLKGKPYNFNGCRYQDLTDDGYLIVADKNTHSIKVMAPDLSLAAVIGGKRGKGAGVFATPEGVVIRGRDIWFSDSGNDRIVRYKITSH